VHRLGKGAAQAARHPPAVSGAAVAFLRWSLYGGAPAPAGPAAPAGMAILDAQLA
jgi:hypothetical protein